MTSKRRLMLGFTAACSLTALAGAAFADPPGRVGRVSFVEGGATFRPTGEDFWAPAQRNLPVATGEAFWTDADSRLELQVAGVEARLDGQSELDVLDLDYGVTRLSLPQGSVDLHVWRAPRGGIVIATAAGEVRITRPGIYRVDALPANDGGDYGPVEVTAFEGQALAPGYDEPVPVEEGQSATFLPGYDVDIEYAQATEIDRWSRMRDERQAERRRAEALWADYTGADDLDEAGDWIDQPRFGRVWFPRVDPDWAPYRYGHWSYVQPWGWTWIDDQPWGFTPFHYGRWARFGDRWGWAPGRPEAEPVYAPALVAFVGGSGWGVSIGVGGDAMGWVPLAPDEAYVPTYRVSGEYVRRLNTPHVAPAVINNIVVNNTVVINRTVVVYRNAPAATVVRSADFARGGSVQQAVVRAPPGAFAKGLPAMTPDRIAPTREARGGAAFGSGGGAGKVAMGPGFSNAPHPPERLQALRAAVAAQPPGSNQPPAALRPGVAAPRPGGKPLQIHTGGQPQFQGGPNGHPLQSSQPPHFVPPPQPQSAPSGQPQRFTPQQPPAFRPNAQPTPPQPTPAGQPGPGFRPQPHTPPQPSSAPPSQAPSGQPQRFTPQQPPAFRPNAQPTPPQPTPAGQPGPGFRPQPHTPPPPSPAPAGQRLEDRAAFRPNGQTPPAQAPAPQPRPAAVHAAPPAPPPPAAKPAPVPPPKKKPDEALPK